VLESVIKRPTFWVMCLFHAIVKYIFSATSLSHGVFDKWYLAWKPVSCVAAMTTFFLVFYTTECWARYCELYHASLELMGGTYDYLLDMKVYTSRASKEHLRLISRYLSASVAMLFYELHSDSDSNKWHFLRELGLLKQDEVDLLKLKPTTERITILMGWVASVSSEAHAQATELKHCAGGLREGIMKSCWHLRSQQTQLVDDHVFTVPFPYFHLVNTMVLINTMVWAYNFGTAPSLIWSGLFVISTAIFLGMMELASCFADPFGDDDVDFPLAHWLSAWLQQVCSLVECEDEHFDQLYPPCLRSAQIILGEDDESTFNKVQYFDLDNPSGAGVTSTTRATLGGLWG